VSQKGNAKNIKFYAMPLDNEHKKLWISIIENYSGIKALRKNAQLNNAVVCGKHFGFESFRSHSVHESPKLLPNAVPSIFFLPLTHLIQMKQLILQLEMDYQNHQ
jgi:alkyl hydroperoxide reductase subunit AhpF